MIWGDGRKLSDQHLALYEEAISAPGFSEGMLEALRAVGEFKLPAEVLRELDVPRRVVWGEKDRLVSVIQGERLARAINAELSVLNDIGHCVPEEAPEAVAALVHG
jgi:pimeloyl-ACP methyl ester carboxylesterase